NDAFETFSYTIQDSDGDTSSAGIKVDIVDSVPHANNDCEVCLTEGAGTGGEEGIDLALVQGGTASGNVMANDDLGADQFLPKGTTLTSFTYVNGTHTATVPAGGSTTVTTAIGGTLTVHSNGDWTYTEPSGEINEPNGQPLHDDFKYTITDG